MEKDEDETNLQNGELIESSCSRSYERSNDPLIESDADYPKAQSSKRLNNRKESKMHKAKRDGKMLHEKRKANDDDCVQSKRKYQPISCDPPKIIDRRPLSSIAEKGEGEFPIDRNVSSDTLPSLLFSPSSSSTATEESVNQSNSSIEDEVGNLENRGNSNDFEARFTWQFWTSLHANYGSYCGYAFGFLVILLLHLSWMLEEIGNTTEGHSVSKTLVIIFIIYCYSFITIGLEFVQFAFLASEIYLPYLCYSLKRSLKDWNQRYPVLKIIRSGKYFYPALVTLFCMFQSVIGSVIWNWFWWNHICKAYHDRTCKKSWLGKLVIAYRDSACYDGTASSIVCEKFVSYLPIMLFSMAIVFLGNVLLPLINDQLSLSYVPTDDLDVDAALDFIHSLKKKESKSTEEGSNHEINCESE
ncbi:unnamed protein product [Orchesella dallaii]